MAFRIIRNDITRVKADAIVNTANPMVAIGDGVDSAIYEAAGKEKLLRARQKIGHLDIGEVGITPAFHLDAKYIIHSSGPYWNDGKHREEELLRQCYDRALELARKHRCKSIAFPLLSTGSYGFSKDLGLRIALEAFSAFLLRYEMEIILVVFGETAFRLSGKIFDDVQEYVDDTYVQQKLLREYRHDGVPLHRESRLWNGCSTVLSEERCFLPTTFNTASLEPVSESKSLRFSDGKAEKTDDWDDELYSEDSCHDDGVYTGELYAGETLIKDGPPKHYQMQAPSPSQPLDYYMQQEMGSLAEYLQQLINKKGMKNSEVYAAANMTKQYFSKLVKGKVTPSKNKILSLAIALRLNMDEAIDLLCMSGYALSPISPTDKIFTYFISHGIYDIYRIDIVLFDYGLPTLVND